MPKLEVPVEPEENLVVEEIRKAQGVTGELLWLAVRSRPDIAFAVSLMGRHLSKNPRWVVKVGRCVFGILLGPPIVVWCMNLVRVIEGQTGRCLL